MQLVQESIDAKRSELQNVQKELAIVLGKVSDSQKGAFQAVEEAKKVTEAIELKVDSLEQELATLQIAIHQVDKEFNELHQSDMGSLIEEVEKLENNQPSLLINHPVLAQAVQIYLQKQHGLDQAKKSLAEANEILMTKEVRAKELFKAYQELLGREKPTEEVPALQPE